MNRITKETIEKLKLAKSSIDDSNIIDLLSKLINVINCNYELKDSNYLLDNYEDICFILFEGCKLNHTEAGFIFNKIMQYNIAVNKKDNSVAIDRRIFEEYGITIEEQKKLLEGYINDTLPENMKTILDEIIEKQTIRLSYIRNAYKFIENFSKNTNHSSNEYVLLEQTLDTIRVPKELRIAYTLYFKDKEVETYIPKQKEKVIEENEGIVPRRYLKNRFKELYKEETTPYFDMKDIKELMDILKKLNLPDEKIYSILTNLYNYVLENDSYYEFLINKSTYMGLYEDIINEIVNLNDAYLKSDNESKCVIKELLTDLYQSLKPVMTKSFDYEMHINDKVKEKV